MGDTTPAVAPNGGGEAAAYNIDPDASAKYFDEVDAPTLFEKMAMELLRCKPTKSEVMSMLVDILLKDKKLQQRKSLQAQNDNVRATKLFSHLTGESSDSIAWGTFLAKLQLDEKFAKALLPALRPDAEGYITAAEWTLWLSSVQTPEHTLNWIEEQLLLCPVPGWTNELEQRVRQAFDQIDQQFQWDGEVDRGELMSVMSKFALSAKVLFKELDCNSDGGVSITEWLNWFKKICITEGPEIAEDRLEWIEECLSETQQSTHDEKLIGRATALNTALEELAAKLGA